MKIKTISFDPIRVQVDDVNVDILKASYIEEGQLKDFTYIEVNGEKIVIQRHSTLDVDKIKNSEVEIISLEKRAVKDMATSIEIFDQVKFDEVMNAVKETKVQ